MKMNYKYTSTVIISLLLCCSCDGYLDPEPMTQLTKEQATKDYTYSKGRVASIYSDLESGLYSLNGAMFASASDEAEYAIDGSDVQNFNLGTWNQYSNPDGAWFTYYRAISKANQFLVSSDSINLDKYKYDPTLQDSYKTQVAEINRWKYEVRFLRAYFYFELVKRYAGVPLITEPIITKENLRTIPRSSLNDCIQFILDECDTITARKVLPAQYAAEELGRITSVAVLALKSRVLLYAASELFNTPPADYAHPELVSLSGKSRLERWEAAAQAAKDVITLAEASGYGLSEDYLSLFGPKTHTNPEVLLCKRSSNSNSFEKNNFPIGYDEGNSGVNPSQNQVDAYEMGNGKDIADPTSGYNLHNPYMNRDPRLDMSILHNGSSFKGREIETFEGGKDGAPILRATKTGYYIRKYINEDLNLVTNQTSAHSWIIFRLSEFYLNYAEALNECDPGNVVIAAAVNKIRQRADVDMPALPTGLDQAQMRERIYNERRVELAFEGHRFWDVRRWMNAEKYLGAPLMGIKIVRYPDYRLDYTVKEVEERIFSKKMYLYPIPQSEIYVNRNLIQNPLW